MVGEYLWFALSEAWAVRSRGMTWVFVGSGVAAAGEAGVPAAGVSSYRVSSGPKVKWEKDGRTRRE